MASGCFYIRDTRSCICEGWQNFPFYICLELDTDNPLSLNIPFVWSQTWYLQPATEPLFEYLVWFVRILLLICLNIPFDLCEYCFWFVWIFYFICLNIPFDLSRTWYGQPATEPLLQCIYAVAYACCVQTISCKHIACIANPLTFIPTQMQLQSIFRFFKTNSASGLSLM